jgi:hypothetical protein
VVVTILGGTNTERPNVNIVTQNLLAGSVTVLQAPFPKTFTLDLAANNKTLTLNKGYKLQDINITFNLANTGTAVTITDPTAGLASVDVECKIATNAAVTCVQVAGAGSHILRDVRVDVADAVQVDPTDGSIVARSIGILNNDSNANLTIIGGRVRPIAATGTATREAITLINSKGVLTVTGLTVDMANAGHVKRSTGILIRPEARRSSVAGSTITVNNDTTGGNAIGIDVQGTDSRVEGNTFIGSGNSIGVKGSGNLASDALVNNTFLGTFTGGKVVP